MRQLKEKLKVAKAEHKIRLKEYNAAQRALHRVLVTINTLEKKIELNEQNFVKPRTNAKVI